jgi:hypothetical protein
MDIEKMKREDPDRYERRVRTMMDEGGLTEEEATICIDTEFCFLLEPTESMLALRTFRFEKLTEEDKRRNEIVERSICKLKERGREDLMRRFGRTDRALRDYWVPRGQNIRDERGAEAGR